MKTFIIFWLGVLAGMVWITSAFAAPGQSFNSMNTAQRAEHFRTCWCSVGRYVPPPDSVPVYLPMLGLASSGQTTPVVKADLKHKEVTGSAVSSPVKVSNPRL